MITSHYNPHIQTIVALLVVLVLLTLSWAIS